MYYMQSRSLLIIKYNLTLCYFITLTISLNLFPLTAKLGNISKDAHAGDKVTTSPFVAIFLETSTASSKESTIVVGTCIPFSI